CLSSSYCYTLALHDALPIFVLAVPHGHTGHQSDNDDHDSHGDQIALTTVVALALLAHFFGAFGALLSLVVHSTSPTGTTADHMPNLCLVSVLVPSVLNSPYSVVTTEPENGPGETLSSRVTSTA